MYPSSKDERVVVHQFLSAIPRPDLVLYVADISQLEKQLLLLSQIKDLGFPVILALNMADIPGVTIQTHFLEDHLKIPVVLVSGKTGMGIAALKIDRKSTRLNSSHSQISYAVFCLKKKKK